MQRGSESHPTACSGKVVDAQAASASVLQRQLVLQMETPSTAVHSGR